jgi:hypothetical protein
LALSVGVGVGVTHASFAAEVQFEIPQVVRIIVFFPLASSPQPEESEGEEARHLIRSDRAPSNGPPF